MRTLKIFAITLFSLFTTLITLHAQNAADEAAVKKFWNDVNEAYVSGNDDQMWAAYTENAAEIGPDGSLTTGKKALRENWDMFMKMADEKPKFSYTNPAVRFITPDVAIITWDSEMDIKIQGQQVGGKTKGTAVVHKIKGKWFVEFDSLTPIMQMPEAGTAKN